MEVNASIDFDAHIKKDDVFVMKQNEMCIDQFLWKMFVPRERKKMAN